MKVRRSLLSCLIVTFLCMIAMTFSATTVVAEDATFSNPNNFTQTSETGTATIGWNETGTAEAITLPIDTNNIANGGVYYLENVDATMFETTFSITQFNTHGIMRLALLSNKDDFPYPERANGIGISIADGTAYHPENYDENGNLIEITKNSLKANCRIFYSQAEEGVHNGEIVYDSAEQTFTSVVYDINEDADLYYNKEIYLRIKKSTTESTQQDCLNVFLMIGDTSKSWDVLLSDLSTGFDYTNCQFVIVPDYDYQNERQQSWEKAIKVNVHSVSNANNFKSKKSSSFATKGTASLLNRITIPVSATTTLEDGVYFKENVTIYADTYDANVKVQNVFDMVFTIDSFNAYGGLYASFMSSSNEYPGKGTGFGVHFIDDGTQTKLSSNLYSYSETTITNEGGDKVIDFSGNSYAGKYFRIKAWDFDALNFAIQVFVGDSVEEVVSATDSDAKAQGAIKKANIAGFDNRNCTFMLSPMVNTSQATSYAQKIGLSIIRLSNKTLYGRPVFIEKSSKSEVLGTTLSFNVDETTTGATAAANYKKHISIYSGHEFNTTFSIDSFNAHGGLHIGFMSSGNDTPENGYGFGLYLQDNGAGNGAGALNSMYKIYNADAAGTEVEPKIVDKTPVAYSIENYIGKCVRVRVWYFDQTALAMQIYVGNTFDEVNAATDNSGICMQSGALLFTDLPDAFDYTKCALVITPTVDTAQATSYANDVRLTINKVNEDTALTSDVLRLDGASSGLSMVSGASLRLKETQKNSGIRFSMVMDYNQYNKIKYGATIGILIAPQKYVGDGELSLETSGINNYVFKFNGDGVVIDEAKGTVTFNAVVTNVPYGNATDLVARGYVTYGKTYYIDYDMAKNCRNIRFVADTLYKGYRSETLQYTDVELSMMTNYVSATKLETLTVTLNESVASWTAVENATKYAYKINDGDVIETTETSFTLSEGDTIVVRAVGDGENYVDGDWSEAVTYTVTEETV